MLISIRSLKGKLIVIFTILIICLAGAIVTTQIINWNKSIDSILELINYNSSNETVKLIDEFLKIPNEINNSASLLMQNDIIDMGSNEKRDKYFLSIMNIQKDNVYSFSFGTVSGEYYGVRVNDLSELEIMRSNESTGGHSTYYAVNDDMSTGEVVNEFSLFDPRTRAWYKKASNEGSAIFSSIYKHFVMYDLAISAAKPVYDDQDELIGVFGTHFPLTKINEFLAEIGKKYENTTYIIDLETEEVIANSLNNQNFTVDSDNVLLGINVNDIESEVSRKAYEDFDISNPINSVINNSGEKYLVTTTQYTKFGLNWLIITSVGENTYKEPIVSSILDTLIISMTVIIIGIIIWVLFIRKTLKPIDNLMIAAKNIAEGDLNYRASISSDDEIGELIFEFNSMADDIQIAMNASIKDSTEKAILLKELEVERTRFSLAIEGAKDGIWDWDLQTNNLILNDQYEMTLGYAVGSLARISDSFFGLLHPDDVASVKRTIQEYFDAKGENSYENSFRLLTKDGSWKWFLSRGKAQFDETGQPLRFVGYSQDITKSKIAHEELILAKEMAEAANVTKTRFLANMSHEIRTPLNGVLGMIQLIQMTSLTKEQEEYMEISQTSSEALLEVINDILDYSKIEEGKLVLREIKFSFEKILKEVLDLFKSSIRKKNLKIEVMIDPDVPTRLIGDSFRLKQILSNIIGNAVKYTLKGSINIEVSQRDTIDENKINLEVRVKDTGIGIDLDHKNNLFTSFFQVDDSNTRKYGGSGLGLAISKSLVELMGGTIWFESMVGLGSEFIFTLEMKIDLEKTSTNLLVPHRRKDRSDTNKNCKILLVEDDKVSCIVAVEFLKKKYQNIKVAGNGQEAYDLCLKEKFDIILMDVQMPVMGGYEATRMIRELERDTQNYTPIIGITALAYEQDIENCIKAGMDDYLCKPLEKESLFDKIESFVAVNI